MSHTPASPLPWLDSSIDGDCAVILPNGSFLFEAPTEQDAAYIVHACNAYPEMLCALEAVQRALRGEMLADMMLSEHGPTLGEYIADALAKAKGES